MPIEIVYSEAPQERAAHTHVHDELLYVREGAVGLTIRSREYRAEAGSLVFLSPFDEHATRMVGGVYRRYYLLIPPTQMKAMRHDARLLSVFRFHGERFPYVLETGGDKPRFDAYFDMLMDADARGGPYLDDRAEALLTLILTDALALRPDMFVLPDEVSFLPMQALLDALDRDFAQPFSLTALAARYHVSPGCLSSHFRRHVGVSPMQYVTQSRLAHARVLLLHTALPVREVAMQCGYADVSSFVRRFRERFGVTPLRYRAAGAGGRTRVSFDRFV